MADNEEKTPKEEAEEKRFEERWGSGHPKGPEPEGGKDPRKG